MTRPLSLCLLLSLLPVLLAGCADTPTEPARQYLLPAAGEAPADTRAPLPDVDLRVAGYLDQGGIVLQSGPVAVRTARQHRWADPLPEQLRRALLFHLSKDGAPAGGRLTITVVRFQGSGDGRALVAGHWRYKGTDGSKKEGRFEESPPLARDGYEELVKQLDIAWAAAARRISGALRK